MNNKLGFTEWFCIGVISLCFVWFFWVTSLTMHGEVVGHEISEIKICIIGIAGSIVGYVVGSTKSSRDKDKMISDALKSTPVEPEKSTDQN